MHCQICSFRAVLSPCRQDRGPLLQWYCSPGIGTFSWGAFQQFLLLLRSPGDFPNKVVSEVVNVSRKNPGPPALCETDWWGVHC